MFFKGYLLAVLLLLSTMMPRLYGMLMEFHINGLLVLHFCQYPM